MSRTTDQRMTADAFIAWALEQPDGTHYELADGEVIAVSPERSDHALIKFAIARRLAEAVEAAALPCTVYPDGVVVQVDDHTVYEPDALIRCGEKLPPDAVRIHDPIVIVEVLSPSTRGVDTGNKLADYFRLSSLMHYLIVRPADGRVIHHARDAEGGIGTRIHAGGAITLDPPGITVTLPSPGPSGSAP